MSKIYNLINENYIRIYLDITKQLSYESHCIAKKVGCVIVKNNSIISSGINGTPSGYYNCDDIFKVVNNKRYLHENIFKQIKDREVMEDVFKEKIGILDFKNWGMMECNNEEHSKWSSNYEIHAEINAINKLTINQIDVKDCVLFVNYHPCENCAKTIISSGISNIVIGNKGLYDREDKKDEIIRAKKVIEFMKSNGVEVLETF